MPDLALSPPERQWRATLLLGWPLAMAAAPALVSLGEVPLCAFRQISGQPCPLCGGTHACAALLRGDFLAAWQANLGVVPLIAVAAWHSSLLIREAITGRRLVDQTRMSQIWAAGGAFLLLTWGLRLTGVIQ